MSAMKDEFIQYIKERLINIDEKIDHIIKEVSSIYEAIAQNEAEHKNNELEHERIYKSIENLTSKKHESAIALAWLATILSIILSLLNILKLI